VTAFVLVHGGVHGAWCWEPVLSRLRALGHHANAVDLPGRDSGPEPSAAVSLEDWIATVSAALDAAPEPPVLVGHSMGGLTVSALAERRPRDVRAIGYVSAIVPSDGGTGLQTLSEAGPDCVLLEDGALLMSEDGATVSVAPAAARRAFYGRSPEDAVRAALARLCPEPIRPMSTPVALGAGFASVPKTYLGATHDRAVPPAFQQLLAARCAASFVPLDADHSPFYSNLPQLVALLEAV
jgi:pimeloyl-ACP methyl ester carboxylesterase